MKVKIIYLRDKIPIIQNFDYSSHTSRETFRILYVQFIIYSVLEYYLVENRIVIQVILNFWVNIVGGHSYDF